MHELVWAVEQPVYEAMRLEPLARCVLLHCIVVEVLVHGTPMTPPPRAVALQGECPGKSGSAQTYDFKSRKWGDYGLHVNHGRGRPIRVVCGPFLQEVKGSIVASQDDHGTPHHIQIDHIACV